MFLTSHELYELTGRRRRDAQARQLNKMGIVHKIRADGMPMVLISHIHKEFDGAIGNVPVLIQEINLDGVNAP